MVLAATPGVSERRKLLIVDDDAHIRRLLSLYLRSAPFDVFEAATGEEALRVFAEHRFDVVLLDLVLPYHGGFRLCQKFKASLHPPKVVIMTGDNSEESAASARDCGADEFIEKPFDGSDVVRRIGALFEASVE